MILTTLLWTWAATPEREPLQFASTPSAFAPVPLNQLSMVPFRHVRDMILERLPPRIRPTALKSVEWALEYAEDYQIDPFWVLAVMWAESGFRPDALSPKKAQGLMQIMPTTSHYICTKMNWPARGWPLAPRKNVHMGVYYLQHLYRRFKNPALATVAYNMGPTRVQRRIQQALPVGVRNQYLTRVRRYYFILSSPLRRDLDPYLVFRGTNP